MDKIYNPDDYNLKIELKQALIRVYSNLELWHYLEHDPSIKFEALAKKIKEDYLNKFHKPLNISNDSLIVEILIHIYCDYLGLSIHRLIRIGWIQRLLMRLIQRAEIVDCGEKQVDGNRWVWDLLSKYKSSLIKILPKNLNAKNLKNTIPSTDTK